MEEVGAQQVSLPALSSAGLWEKSGRLSSAPAELMKVDDRHGKKYLLAPHGLLRAREFLMMDAYGAHASERCAQQTYAALTGQYHNIFERLQLPLRAREFLMMDAYGAHALERCAQQTYAALTGQYHNIFERLQLPVYKAPTGDMGGSLSHEWQLCASAGEDALSVCPSCSHATRQSETDSCRTCGREMEKHNSI
ncbi:putative prolyl-tRNA synthetase, partial [Operophtera brumata]